MFPLVTGQSLVIDIIEFHLPFPDISILEV